MDLRSVIDPTGDGYAAKIADLVKKGALAANQAAWLLQQNGFLPDGMPAGTPVVSTDTKGGDSDDESSNQG